MKDSSLDDFLRDDTGGDGEDSDGARSDVAFEPAKTTYEWNPTSIPCDSCGATVERRWRDGEAMVCRDCKTW